MFTSWSEQSTPAELSMASVLIRPSASANSTRARWVNPRLPPSPTTRQRRSAASTRTASLVRSATSAWLSVLAFTNVPMPPFHRRSTGARRIAETSSSGVSVRSAIPSTAHACADTVTDFASRGKTAPPGESFVAS